MMELAKVMPNRWMPEASLRVNVLDNDKGADQDLSLTQVVHDETIYEFDEGSNSLTIGTDGGELTINRDGSYTFTADDVTPVSVPGNSMDDWQDGTDGLWGFGTGNSPLARMV
ncbi:hypothetical protein DSL92_08680 [Billgrantia gudaonensis]|uniref:Uncharacterized protein n=1 Tax=Billgrantia gudaonensis TaxID=376427 RepID=A0A3S0QFJ8_9GAMM|nr:hypothetical protein DSL92_08680 [Halomonas gudaonensis]